MRQGHFFLNIYVFWLFPSKKYPKRAKNRPSCVRVKREEMLYADHEKVERRVTFNVRVFFG